MQSRTFSHGEAVRTLPLVRPVMEDVVRSYGRLSELAEEYKGLRMEIPRTPEIEGMLSSLKAGMAALSEEIDGYVAEIDEIGCEAKDLETGTVDFISRLDGRRVCLCWRLGEESIEHWHEVTEGFEGRKPLPVTVPED